ncbi:dTMP kinase [Streptomyces sp. NPDC001549]|uniref:dTMP kinase n=1 Tax=Streptomyces sp. NPDC001549 TaxID=3364586 RepID=UPI0036AA2A9B
MNAPSGPYAPLAETGVRMGPFVVLEGVSAVGKSTLARLLADRLGAMCLHTLPAPHDGWSRTVHAELRRLPALAFYLSGLLHASDTIRVDLAHRPVIADRYTSSVIACQAAVSGATTDDVAWLLAPFRPYLVVPDATFYLRSSEATLKERMGIKPDTKEDDTELFAVPGRLAALWANFEEVAATDPTAVLLDTDGRTPDQLADFITDRLKEQRA